MQSSCIRSRSRQAPKVGCEAPPYRLRRGSTRVPALVPAAAEPGGWRGLAYYRLHGSPATYRSSYDDGRLEAYARRLAGGTAPAWCIFDNTASSAATSDALKLKALTSLSL